MRDLLDPLWGSILDRIDIDLPQHSLAIEAHAIDGAVTTHCRLDCTGVTDFHYSNEDLNIEQWNHTSIEEAELRQTTDGRVEVRLELWVPEWTLTITAADAQLRTGGGTSPA